MSAMLEDEIHLRLMTPDDVPAVIAIEAAAHAAPWTEGIFRDCLRVGYQCEVLELDGVIVGYTVMSVAAGEAHLFNVCIDKDWQGRGFGRLLVNHVIDEARSRKAFSVFLEVRPSNKPAISLYEDLGFVEVGVRKDYYPCKNGKREDALIFARDL